MSLWTLDPRPTSTRPLSRALSRLSSRAPSTRNRSLSRQPKRGSLPLEESVFFHVVIRRNATREIVHPILYKSGLASAEACGGDTLRFLLVAAYVDIVAADRACAELVKCPAGSAWNPQAVTYYDIQHQREVLEDLATKRFEFLALRDDLKYIWNTARPRGRRRLRARQRRIVGDLAQRQRHDERRMGTITATSGDRYVATSWDFHGHGQPPAGFDVGSERPA